MINKTVEALCQAAKIENILIYDKSRTFIIDTTNLPVLPRDVAEHTRKTIYATNGAFVLKYEPSGAYQHRKRTPFVIKCDFLRIMIYVSGPKHLHILASKMPEIDWIVKNTTYNDDLFYWAKRHPGISMPFSIDVSKYCRKIEDKAIEMGYDVSTYKPLVLFCFSEKLADVKFDRSEFELQDADAQRMCAEMKQTEPDQDDLKRFATKYYRAGHERMCTKSK